MLGSRVEQSRTFEIFANRVRVIVLTNSVDDLRPGLAVIARLVDVRLAVIELITLRCYIGRAGRIGRRVDDAYPRERRKIGRRDVCPGLPTVTGNEDESIIRASPYSHAVAR